jgi:hypothetical protein
VLSLLLVVACAVAALPAAALTTGGAAVTEQAAAVRNLLAARSAAVVSGDSRRWAATVAPGAGDFAARQDALFATLVGLPRAAWTYSYAGPGPALPFSRARELGDGAFIARVRLSYRLAGIDEGAVQRDQYLTLARRGGRWLIAGDDDARDLGRRAPDPWDLGELDLAKGRSSLVLARPGSAGLSGSGLAGLAGLADRAVEQVQELWPGPWPGRVVVIVPADMAEMARLVHDGGPGDIAAIAQLAAVTTGQPSSDPDGTTTGNRIIVNPTVFVRLTETGRQVVLTHEATHVATRTLGGAPVPSWLSEGFADYVAYRATDMGVQQVAGDVLTRVRTGAGPVRLPTEIDFDASRGHVSESYALAWLAVRHIAQSHGQPRLVEFYLRAAAGRPGDPVGAIDAAFGEALGISAEQFDGGWGRAVADLAAVSAPAPGVAARMEQPG